jgi:uncharacterized damage-inducible protein DinB
MDTLQQLRYPIGPMPRLTEPLTTASRATYLAVLEEAPARFRALTSGLSDAHLDTPYRPGGWTVRQVVHHVPDSHLNAYIRMKLAATEASPPVKTYEEALWAELPEARSGAIEMSLALLEALHRRWVAFLRALPAADLQRTFQHPTWGTVTIEESIVMYSWHCRHHAAHISNALRQAGDHRAGQSAATTS